MRLDLAARGGASPAEVWARYADHRRWPDWSLQIRRVAIEGPGTPPPDAPGAGVTGTVHGPPGVVVPFAITAWDAPRSWAWWVRPAVAGVPLGTLALHHGVEDDGAGSRATLTLDGPAPLVLAYAPAARHALGRLVRP